MCGAMKQISELLLRHREFFFFFFWWGAKFFRSESNFTATELNLFLNLLNSSNLHPQLSR